MKGEVVYLYAFDVASEIITGKVKDILADATVPICWPSSSGNNDSYA